MNLWEVLIMPPKGKGGKSPKEAATLILTKKIQQILWWYKCHLHFEVMNYMYHETIYQYALLQH